MNKYYLVKKEEVNSFINYVKKNYSDYKFLSDLERIIKAINDDNKYQEYIFEFYVDNFNFIHVYYNKDVYNNIKISYTNILRKEKINKILFSVE